MKLCIRCLVNEARAGKDLCGLCTFNERLAKARADQQAYWQRIQEKSLSQPVVLPSGMYPNMGGGSNSGMDRFSEQVQDRQRAANYSWRRQGVWVVEELPVHEENGVQLGTMWVKTLIVRPEDVKPTENSVTLKGSVSLADGCGYADPYPGEGL